MAQHNLPAASSVFFIIFSLFLFAGLTNCKEILVGGKSNGWKVPSSPSDSLNKWAENSRFHVGDTLVWKYDGEKDSVLRVTKQAYVSCNTSHPVAKYDDGDTKVKLEKHGPLYFISGSKTNCEEGEKLIVIVMSQRTSHGFFAGVSPSPAPSPMAVLPAPAIAPATTGDAASSRLLPGGVFMAAWGAVGLWTLFL